MIPLPERLLCRRRDFAPRISPINSAGPRDLQTGFPVGGSAAFVNSTELRIPSVPLPWIGQKSRIRNLRRTGNVFQNVSANLPAAAFPPAQYHHLYNLKGPGNLNFNYDLQNKLIGLGLRYNTLAGSIRGGFQL